MNAVSDENPDVDSAGVYFVSVEEFEQREPIDNEPERPSADQSRLEIGHEIRPGDRKSTAALRRFRGHSTGASSS